MTATDHVLIFIGGCILGGILGYCVGALTSTYNYKKILSDHAQDYDDIIKSYKKLTDDLLNELKRRIKC